MGRATEALEQGDAPLVAIAFRSPHGSVTTIDAQLGANLMSQAKEANIHGIDADCGGSMVCGTCQVFIDEPWLSLLPPPSVAEALLVEYGLHPSCSSRLSCQLVVTGAMAGMTVDVPSSQK